METFLIPFLNIFEIWSKFVLLMIGIDVIKKREKEL